MRNHRDGMAIGRDMRDRRRFGRDRMHRIDMIARMETQHALVAVDRDLRRLAAMTTFFGFTAARRPQRNAWRFIATAWPLSSIAFSIAAAPSGN
ncbi:MAG: hypothetical protein ACK4Z4_11900, partial [Ferrovibrio sp.]